jgi:hypothetical protein
LPATIIEPCNRSGGSIEEDNSKAAARKVGALEPRLRALTASMDERG